MNIIKNLVGTDTQPQRFGKRAIIYQEGDLSEHLFLLIKGRVKMVKALADDKKVLIQHFFYPSEFVGIGEIISRMKRRRMAAIAVDKEVVLWRFSAFKFEMELRANDKLAAYITTQLIKKREEAWRRHQNRRHLSSAYTVMAALVDLAKARGVEKDGGVAIQSFAHRDLAAYIGICRQSTTSALNVLKRENKIEYTRNEILIKVKPLTRENMASKQLNP